MTEDLDPTLAVAAEDEEEDDYMSMAIVEPKKSYQKETYTERRQRLQREAESKNPKSKKQIAEEARVAREKALSTALPQTSKGAKMLAKFGFQPGESLGAKHNPNARLEPLELLTKDDRGGIGMDSEKKRKIREATENEAKRVKAEEGDFRQRIAKERETERKTRQVFAAQKVAERMDEEDVLAAKAKGQGVAAELAPVVEEKEGLAPEPQTTKTADNIPIKQVNVLWRGLARHRAEKERERRMRHDLIQSLSQNPNYNEDNERQDRSAFGTEVEDLDGEDPELEEFNAFEPAEQLDKVVAYLRERWYYCFWCKHQYADDKMEGCPGLTEDDHD